MKNNDLVERFKLKGKNMNGIDKQLVDDKDSLWATYNGTGGSVNRESSQLRAAEEISSGKLALRQRQILDVLEL